MAPAVQIAGACFSCSASAIEPPPHLPPAAATHLMTALDPQTLLTLNVVNLLALAILLPFIMGQKLSSAAQAARRSLIVHSGAWIAVILSELWPTNWWLNISLSTVSMICYSSCNWLLYQALTNWLGERPFRRPLIVLAIVMPIGYFLFFDTYAWRVGWANLLIAIQVAILANATLRPKTRLVGPWRYVLCLCLGSMSVFTLARGVLGFFFEPLYPNFAAPHPINLISLVIANITMVLGSVSVLVAWREEAELQLRDLTVIDPLTGLLNRRGWSEQATPAFSSSLRHQLPLALLALDLDFFKRINDERGHEAGDAALRLFGEVLRQQARTGDVLARMGGEEFCVLLPLTDAEAAKAFEARIRTTLEEAAVARLGFSFSYSAGLTHRSADDRDLEKLQLRADEALYLAKSEGRARLVER
ncbi:diguanylate cyclase [Rhodocyclus tenuis]|uniref:diguanylate cyclase n=2 Tax=Rhodocyclus TaxID=1064 RepID=A0A6L5JVA3_RHOTE|nr:diguanylate cyclase [Rhodocyclus gracilis]